MTLFRVNRSSASQGVISPGRLLFLEISGGRIRAMNPDGSAGRSIVIDCRRADCSVVDTDAGNMYRTNMGLLSANEGSIERAEVIAVGRLGLGPVASAQPLPGRRLSRNGNAVRKQLPASVTGCRITRPLA